MVFQCSCNIHTDFTCFLFFILLHTAEASPNPEIAEKLDQQMPNFSYLNFDRQYVLAALEYLEPGHQRLLFHAAHGLASFGDEYCLKVFEQLEKEGTSTCCAKR